MASTSRDTYRWMERRTVDFGSILAWARLAFKEDHFDLLTPQHDAADVLMRVVLVVAEQVRVYTIQQRTEHPPTVPYIVVQIVSREREDIAVEEADRPVSRTEHKELCGEGDDLELDDRSLRRMM